MPALRRAARGAAGGDEARDVGHHVVGGERQHHRRVAPPQRMHRAGDDRGRGVAPNLLQQDVASTQFLGVVVGAQQVVEIRIGDATAV